MSLCDLRRDKENVEIFCLITMQYPCTILKAQKIDAIFLETCRYYK